MCFSFLYKISPWQWTGSRAGTAEVVYKTSEDRRDFAAAVHASNRYGTIAGIMFSKLSETISEDIRHYDQMERLNSRTPHPKGWVA